MLAEMVGLLGVLFWLRIVGYCLAFLTLSRYHVPFPLTAAPLTAAAKARSIQPEHRRRTLCRWRILNRPGQRSPWLNPSAR
jgi:hypothetical protein